MPHDSRVPLKALRHDRSLLGNLFDLFQVRILFTYQAIVAQSLRDWLRKVPNLQEVPLLWFPSSVLIDPEGIAPIRHNPQNNNE